MVTVKIEMQLERLCLKLMSATSQPTRWTRARLKHANTFQTTTSIPLHDHTTTTTLCTAAPYLRIQPTHEPRCLLDYAVGARQARHQRAKVNSPL